MKILFVDDCNGHEGDNPRATLVDIPDVTSYSDVDLIKSAEFKQAGVLRMGGQWQKAVSDTGFDYSIISKGRESDYKIHQYDVHYYVISGNY